MSHGGIVILTGFEFGAIKDLAQGAVPRGHYSKHFDCNDPRRLTLALFIFRLADFRDPLPVSWQLFEVYTNPMSSISNKRVLPANG